MIHVVLYVNREHINAIPEELIAIIAPLVITSPLKTKRLDSSVRGAHTELYRVLRLIPQPVIYVRLERDHCHLEVGVATVENFGR